MDEFVKSVIVPIVVALGGGKFLIDSFNAWKNWRSGRVAEAKVFNADMRAQRDAESARADELQHGLDDMHVKYNKLSMHVGRLEYLILRMGSEPPERPKDL